MVSQGGRYYTQPYTRTVGWHNYAVTHTAGGAMGSLTAYIDGSEVVTTRTYIGADPTYPVNTVIDGTPLMLGNWVSGLYPAKHKVAHFSIWNRTLTPSEMQTYLYTNLTGDEPGLVRYYKMNEGTGTSLADLASGGYNATLLNSPTWVGRDIP
jgi:hypothetical protein